MIRFEKKKDQPKTDKKIESSATQKPSKKAKDKQDTESNKSTPSEGSA